MIIKIILVFFSYVVIDFLWSIYIKTVADHKMFKASVYSALIMLCGGFSVIEYVNNHWLLIPAAIGCFVGTYISKFIKPKDKDNG